MAATAATAALRRPPRATAPAPKATATQALWLETPADSPGVTSSIRLRTPRTAPAARAAAITGPGPGRG
ncbi:MAG: hypothetical protein AVDCRST_MAG30-2362 [uncultured Solirubrobacteraceae bacterium]|uniref:Uncharacterized protein n=1 Tax=uncultured Solirubrobacteraceae bacterium TaxID=1162706 RepID=A0A6J4SYJ3_9ACTN|nr:MAG: hypothetical protein AVDCRST_MAG30-2362 [uncultured Solirubrobacteraceae bacterium]